MTTTAQFTEEDLSTAREDGRLLAICDALADEVLSSGLMATGTPAQNAVQRFVQRITPGITRSVLSKLTSHPGGGRDAKLVAEMSMSEYATYRQSLGLAKQGNDGFFAAGSGR